MKREKKIIAILIATVLAFVSSHMVFASPVRYKDINSISIRTNFNFDYESVQSDGLPEITFNSEGSDSDMVYVAKTAHYYIDSCE